MKNERIGLWMIAAALLAIVTITGLVCQLQRDARVSENHRRAASLVRVLSAIPFDLLVPERGREGPLAAAARRNDGDFAYAAVVSPAGRLLAQVSASGIDVPDAPLPSDPLSWLGERDLEVSREGRKAREFYAPVFRAGELSGHVRVGYLDPGYGFLFSQARSLGLLALPVSLLLALSWVLVKRELAGIHEASQRIGGTLEGGRFARLPVDGSPLLRDLASAVNGFVSDAEDRLTALHAQQASLLTSAKVASYQKARVEAVLETHPDATLVMDETGVTTYVNAKLAALLALDPAAILGRRAAEWCPDARVVAFLADYCGAAPRLRRSDCVEFEPSGSAGRTISLSAHPLHGPDGRAASFGTLALFRDVSGAVIARKAQADFLSHIAHEFKSPLNSIALYNETLLGKDGEFEERRIEACNVIQDEVERLSTLISGLLTIARIESGQVALDRQPVRVAEFLQDTLDRVSRGAGQRLSFALDVPRDFPRIQFDKDLIRVALNNLLSNAAKYSDPGGAITLSASDEGGQIAIRVRDTGIGIAPADVPRVFDRFFRSAEDSVRARAGHGLGLTLAKQIAELHGGEIELQSELGVGSVFSLVFPRAAVIAEPV